MSATSYNPAPESRRRGGGDARHPVLARLPDVSVPPTGRHPMDRDAEPVEYVDYRFDAPAGTEDNTAPVRRMTRPHAFEHTSYESRLRSPRRASHIQPDSDPFSLPTSSLYDRLAPVARFLVLFALFTAAGTAFLMKGGFAKPTNKSTAPANLPAPPASTTYRQTLEPAPVEVRSAKLEVVAPTASGPIGAGIRSDVADLFAEIDEQTSTDAKKEPPAATPATPALAGVNGVTLPRLQTTDPQQTEIVSSGAEAGRARPEASAEPKEPIEPPAIARLPGIIREVEPRQAHHVENQSGLH